LNKLEIATLAAELAKKTDDDSIELCKRFTNHAAEICWTQYKWKESVALRTVEASTANTLILPWPIEFILAYRFGPYNIRHVEKDWLFGVDPEIFERTGRVAFLTMMEPVGVHTLPAVASRLLIETDSDEDTEVTVALRGTDADEAEIREEVLIEGLSGAMSENSYLIPNQIAKPADAVGIFTIKDTSGVELVTLYPGETERKHTRIQFHEKPLASETGLLLGKRRFRPMMSDYDTPEVPGIDLAIAHITLHFMYKWMEQTAKSKAQWDQGLALLKQKHDERKFQGNEEQGLIPDDDMDFGGPSRGYGMRSKFG
jgi:hypothetical protein